ncbi:uncharacterized protein si:ch73-347e22.8 [Anabas testudineus]|uniref:uncharacterized protein si:ch73-347e22.8 n=1 Tax=Anabas testudineus TaxID=64144 RepID=UPI00143D9893|nr:uncharacterized protein si:ch73-347e22.8 [Anabas testudineus]
MRAFWILAILSTLVSMGLLVVTIGQYQMLTILKKKNEELNMQSEKHYKQLTDEEIFKITLQNLVTQGGKLEMDLKATMAKLSSDIEKTKAEIDACQAEKKTKTDELAGPEKEHTQTEATIKAESEAWNKEITTLKTQLATKSPICAHVKKNEVSQRLCNFTNTT